MSPQIVPDSASVGGHPREELKRVSELSFSNVDKKTVDGECSVRLCNYTDVYYNDFITDRIDFMEASAKASEIARFQLRRGDVLITKDSETADDIAVPALVDGELSGVLCGYHLAVVRPKKDKVDGRFLFRALQAEPVRHQFYQRANGVTRFGLSQSSIGKVQVPVPPLETQRAIAEFLDRKTAAIDALIQKKERLIELLQEKRQALITQAVTKGLDPGVPMKDSGIEWLGQIPAHWEVVQLRRGVSRFIDYRGKTPTKSSGGVPLITAGAIRDGVIDHSRAPEFIPEDSYDDWMRRGLPELGDVAITTEAPLGEVAQVADAEVAFAQRVILFKLDRSKLQGGYLRYFYLSLAGKSELLSRGTGSTAQGIRSDRLKGSLILLPSSDEQEQIVRFLDSRNDGFRPMLEAIVESTEHLREYRQALITNAVTGKLDLAEVTA